jgi:hypothetical protein
VGRVAAQASTGTGCLSPAEVLSQVVTFTDLVIGNPATKMEWQPDRLAWVAGTS